MATENAVARETVQLLRALNTCQVADAIEKFNARLRNEGFMDSSIRCMLPDLPSMVGYAVTARIRTSAPPMSGRAYPDRTDWWNFLLTIPTPRVVVLEDLDRKPGIGSCAGEVHAHIFKALGCVGLITNGAVRDLKSAESIGFSFFAGNAAVSRAYYHMLEFGLPVEVGSLKVRPGDLLHGDRHGVINVPPYLAGEIPATVARIEALERRVMEVADSPNPSLEELRKAVQQSLPEDKLRG
ncbi:MAG TPA: RraA family protein [Terriglobia bacterium]|nr:RraA family protein [Terriglobia bacterium]